MQDYYLNCSHRSQGRKIISSLSARLASCETHGSRLYLYGLAAKFKICINLICPSRSAALWDRMVPSSVACGEDRIVEDGKDRGALIEPTLPQDQIDTG